MFNISCAGRALAPKKRAEEDASCLHSRSLDWAERSPRLTGRRAEDESTIKYGSQHAWQSLRLSPMGLNFFVLWVALRALASSFPSGFIASQCLLLKTVPTLEPLCCLEGLTVAYLP
ncbi:unnamed protein product [Durusdinium trenchii]|uniref:Uncharacterized protein n=1 Tax=Durusdinium trenchii TaxID=1381693 RepID=A0ABP0P716_9DINO